jgi:uncharacterized protein
MIVDSHVHILSPRMSEERDAIAAADPWFAVCHPEQRRVAGVRELIAAMDDAAIDRAVCFTWPFRDPALCAEANDYLAGAVREFPDRLIGFATVNPSAPSAASELRRCAQLGLRGVGEVNCDAGGFALDDPAIDAAVAASIQLELPWNLHCSEPVGHAYAGKGSATPEKIARFAERHPELRLICAHLGGGLPFYAHMPEVAALCKRLWFDTAAGPLLYAPSAYRSVADLIGAERLFFGSDFPLLVARRYREAFAAAGLTQPEEQLVMGAAAGAFFGL